MANIVVAAAGAAVGFMVGGPTGAAIGWSLGSMLIPPKGQKAQQQPLMDLKVTGTEWGQHITWGRGKFRTAGQMWWNTDRRPVTTTTSTGGKGGKPKQETQTTVYLIDILYGLTDREIVGIARIWDNGDLIWTSDSGATAGSLEASASTSKWERITVYTGAADQLPDPTYEAAVGTANAVAYRGRGSVFIQGLNLGTSGQLRNLTFEVVVDGEASSGEAEPLLHEYPDPPTLWVSPPLLWNEATGELWAGVYGDTEAFSRIDATTLDELGYIIRSPNPAGELIDTTGAFLYDADANRVWYSPTSNGPSGNGRRLYGFDATTGSLSTTWDIGDSTTAIYRMYLDADSNLWGAGYSFDGADLYENQLARINKTTGAVEEVFSLILTPSDNAPGVAQFLPGNVVFPEEGDYFYTVSYPQPGFTEYLCRIHKTTGVIEDVYKAASTISYIVYDATRHSIWMMLGTTDVALYDIDADFVDSKPDVSAPHDGSFIDQHEPVMLDPYRDWIWQIADEVLYAYELPGFTEVFTYDVETFIAGKQLVIREDAVYINHWGFHVDGFDAITKLSFSDATITSTCPTVQDVVEEMCLRAGLDADKVDATGLSTITKPVCSFPIAQLEPTRSGLEQLMSSHFFEMTMSDKIYFRPRGGSSVVTIPYLDLGAHLDDEQPDPLPLKVANDLEIPAHIAVTYPNIDDDYQTDTQPSDRLITATSETTQVVTMTIGMTPSEAKAIADTMALDMVVSSLTTPITLLGDYCRLEPTDPVTVIAGDGSSLRLRLVKKTDSYPLLSFDAVMDDVSILTSQGITSADYTSSTVVTALADTVMELLDIPILQDADNDTGLYVVTKGDEGDYPGSAVFDSPDDIEYTQRTTIQESAVIGDCTTTLGDWTGPRIFDEVNSVTVDVGGGELASSTREAVLNNQAVNSYAIGVDGRWELGQFVTATLQSPGVYKLTGLLRGSRGTEWAMTDHTSAETFVLLRSAGMRRIILQNNELGLERYYKGVTLGRSINSADAQPFTNNAIGLKPFSPFDLRDSRDGSDNITFTWQRRSRLSVRMIGALGISVPVGEPTERYEIDIYPVGSPASLVKTLEASTTEYEYTASARALDGLTASEQVLWNVRQISEVVGRGYESEEAVA